MMLEFQLFQPASTDDALGLLEQYGSEVLGVGRGPRHVGLAQGPGEAAGGHSGRGGGSRRGGATNAPAVFVRYDTVDGARDAAKQLMHEHQRVVRVMIVEEPSRFVEWMDRG